MTSKIKTPKDSKQFLDTQVECIHKTDSVKVYQVSIKEGIFTVLDYKDRFSNKPDTEIYYTRYTDPVSPNSKEYKMVDQIVTNFLKNFK